MSLQFLTISLSFLLRPLPLDIPLTLLLLLHRSYNIRIHKLFIHIECLSPEGSAKDSYGIEYETGANFNEGGGGGLAGEFALVVGFFGCGGGLF
jgi:hypothetical protein